MTPERFAEVERICQTAIDLPPDRRSVYLDGACAGDADLRLEVESLLAGASRAERLLETPPVAAAPPRRLEPGERLGAYEITGELGAGGMGSVYRARDTRLGRTVALKVVGESVAFDPASRERFTREARIVSSLAHPRICALYDVGREVPSGHGPGANEVRSEAVDFIVMEYVEGETLASRLRKGPLRPDQAIDIAAQIADALAFAHRQGVVHRDLKPANVMLTKAGAKLLDFGLATSVERPVALPVPNGGSATNAPSITAPGLILGTVRYMAPEQVEGKAADARTDLWALGVVTYEMLAGEPPFGGETAAAAIAAILDHEPAPLSSCRPLTPPAFDRVVSRCLAKDPERRWQNAADLAEALRWAASDASAGHGAPPQSASRSRVRAWAAAGALLVLLAVALVVGTGSLRGVPGRGAIQFSVQAPEGVAFRYWERPSVSPDGEQIVFGGTTADGRSSLWLRRLDSTATKPLSAGAANPVAFPADWSVANSVFWKPDSRQMAFISGGALMRTDLSGSPPQKVCDEPAGGGGSWSRDGVIVFGTPKGPLYRVSEQGGVATPATSLDASRQEMSHAFPWFLPDGTHFLYLARSTKPSNTGVFVGTLDGAPPKLILTGDSFAMYASPGYLLFLRGSVLVAQPFDSKNLRVTGEPRQVADQVASLAGTTAALQSPLASVSEAGVLCYLLDAAASTQLVWFDRVGANLGRLGEAADYTNPALSPDERQLAVGRRDPQTGTRDIWVIDIARGGISSRLTFDPADDFNPEWSPDGSQVAFSSNRRQWHRDLFRKPASGAGADELLWGSPEDKAVEDWAADGTIYFNFESRRPANGTERPITEIWAIRPPTAIGQAVSYPGLLLNAPGGCDQGRVSPDGRWIAYRSVESGRMEVYLQSLPPSDAGRLQISTGGGLEPRWRGDGKEVFYLEGSNLMAAAVDLGQAVPRVQTPTKLFVAPLDPVHRRNRYVVTKDGKRFLFVTPLSPTAQTLQVIVNWTALLKPAGAR